VTTAPRRGPPATLLYDADCGFCRWSLAKLLAWDGRGALRPVAIQSEEGERLLADLTEERRKDSWHLVEPDGTRRSAGAAAGPLLRRLPGGTPLALLFEALPGPTERGYRLVSRHRGWLGRAITGGAARRARRRIERREAIDR
jgi:predicted DCC family thiol-disulfide oxidoreductase YuxK